MRASALHPPQAGLADLKARSAAELEAARTQVSSRPSAVSAARAVTRAANVTCPRHVSHTNEVSDICHDLVSCVPQVAELSAACEAAAEQLHQEEAAHANTRRKLVQRSALARALHQAQHACRPHVTVAKTRTMPLSCLRIIAVSGEP